MNSGRIIREPRSHKFTIVSNAMLQDKNLSAKAKGLLCTLLSLPEDWVIYKKQLPDLFTDGYDSLATGFDELIKAGYIHPKQLRDNGKYVGWQYMVYDEQKLPPSEENPEWEKNEPIREIPEPVNPVSETPDLQNTNSTKNEEYKQSLVNSQARSLPNETAVPEKGKAAEPPINPSGGEESEAPPPDAGEIPPQTPGADTPPIAYKRLVQERFRKEAGKEAMTENYRMIREFLKENAGYPFPEPYVDAWNIFAQNNGLPQVTTINESRRRKIRIRVKEKQFDFIKILIEVKKSGFALGDASKWRVTFDWLIENDSNYVKILEGQYS